VRVVRADEALQDPASRRRGLAARHHQVLERNRDPEQRRQRRNGVRACLPRLRQPLVRRSGGGACPLLVERHPRIEHPVLRPDQLQVRVEQLERAEVTRAQADRHLVSA